MHPLRSTDALTFSILKVTFFILNTCMTSNMEIDFNFSTSIPESLGLRATDNAELMILLFVFSLSVYTAKIHVHMIAVIRCSTIHVEIFK